MKNEVLQDVSVRNMFSVALYPWCQSLFLSPPHTSYALVPSACLSKECLSRCTGLVGETSEPPLEEKQKPHSIKALFSPLSNKQLLSEPKFLIISCPFY